MPAAPLRTATENKHMLKCYSSHHKTVLVCMCQEHINALKPDKSYRHANSHPLNNAPTLQLQYCGMTQSAHMLLLLP